MTTPAVTVDVRRVVREIGGITFEESGTFAALLDTFVGVLAERDSARRWAVKFEQDAEEYLRRVNVALGLLDDALCECSRSRDTSPLVCTKHRIEDVLRMGITA